MSHLPRGIFKVLAVFAFVSLTFLTVLPSFQVQAAPTALWNTFGAKKKISKKGVPQVQGVDAYMTTPDTPTGWGEITAAPVGVSNWDILPFAESGPYKKCEFQCGYHVYWSYMDVQGIWETVFLDDINLLPNGWYEYRTSYLGNNMWRIEFCDGNGCIVLQDVNLKTNRVKYAAAGGEGIDTNFGPVTSAAFKWRNVKGVWANACYTDVLRTVDGQITPCGGNFDWTVQFP